MIVRTWVGVVILVLFSIVAPANAQGRKVRVAMPSYTMPEPERLPRLRTLLETLHDGAHPLRIALDKLQTLDTVRIIEGKS